LNPGPADYRLAATDLISVVAGGTCYRSSAYPWFGNGSGDNMQRYSFRVTEGKYSDSDLAVDLPDKVAARKEALAMCIDLVPSVLRGMQTDTNWQLEVTDQTGKQVYRLKLCSVSAE
jgi:hypothetical protein